LRVWSGHRPAAASHPAIDHLAEPSPYEEAKPTVCNDVAMNRLANSWSPYLLQHAANPVDWWPWGEEAMTEAKRRDVPLLISVGYSSCHLCFC